IITKELAKLYEKQGYLEDSLVCYTALYEETKNQEFADAIENIKSKISPNNNILPQEENKNEPVTGLSEPSDSESKKKKDNRALELFEEWLGMLILEKKIESFKKIQVKHE
ncbi:MAG: hypothetical protein GY707_11085, partial [Desulfobacteraceae bacterium]|nr:hypothetical protein [Desulfobacteraceae bacterium]